MNASDKTIIEYFIPEDGQKENDCSVFVVKKPVDKVMIDDIVSCFPEQGEFHFRFKFNLKKVNYWIDFNNNSKPVPQYEEGRVVIKASRLLEQTEELEY
jgi:hypothetical protein